MLENTEQENERNYSQSSLEQILKPSAIRRRGRPRKNSETSTKTKSFKSTYATDSDRKVAKASRLEIRSKKLKQNEELDYADYYEHQYDEEDYSYLIEQSKVSSRFYD